MAALRSCLEQAGYRDVTTILASGNVLLRSPIHPPEQLEQQLSALIEDRFGLRSAVVVRRHDQLATALATHPFADAESQPSRSAQSPPAEVPGSVVSRQSARPWGVSRANWTKPFSSRSMT